VANKKTGKNNSAFKDVLIVILILVIIALLIMLINEKSKNGSLFNRAERESVSGDLSEYLQVHYIDVGQGDSALLISPDGETMLIDAGKPSAADTIVSYIKDLGIDQLDYMVITHLHDDHYGSATSVIEKIGVDSVFLNGAEADNSSERKLFSCIEDNNCDAITVSAGYTMSMGEVAINVLGPVSLTDKGGNNDSIVMKVTYENSSFLFTGDAEKEEEAAILEKYGSFVSADVLKAGHHGSSTSSSEEFITQVSPSVAIISCGTGNSYGHPHQSTLDRYAAHRIEVYRTDLLGAVILASDGEKIMYYEESGASAADNPLFTAWVEKRYYF